MIAFATIRGEFNELLRVLWDPDDGAIWYEDAETLERWTADESADSLENAWDDTYLRYQYGWDLEYIGEVE